MKSDLAAFRDRFAHAHNKLLWHVPSEVRTGRFLDIGCGIGNGVIAAARHGASESVGIDRNLHEFSSIFSPEDFPDICKEFEVDIDRISLVEADIYNYDISNNYFDYAMMLDSIEHVHNPGDFIEFAYKSLRRGGCFIMDTCPLYFSPQGAHLFSYFSAEEYPWVHLWHDFGPLLAERNVDQWSLDRFNELNRVTHDDLRRLFAESGFEVVQEVRSEADEAKRGILEKFRHKIRPEFLQRESLLFEDWVLLVGRKDKF